MKLGWRQRRSENLAEEKNIFPFAGDPNMTAIWRSSWPSDQLRSTGCFLRRFYVLKLSGCDQECLEMIDMHNCFEKQNKFIMV